MSGCSDWHGFGRYIIAATLFISSIFLLCLFQPFMDVLANTPPSQEKNPKGRLVFVSQRDGNAEIYIMNADGSRAPRLTYDPYSDAAPSLSPDGKSIAFESERAGNADIYVMQSNGASLKQLTTSPQDDRFASFSPDGKTIAFASARDGNWEIYVMKADGSNQRRLTTQESDDEQPVFSPDGNSIAFTTDRQSTKKNYRVDIFLMNRDGSNSRFVCQGSAPTFNVQGEIAFVRAEQKGQSVFIIKTDGTNLRRVSPLGMWADSPSFSPDGSALAFTLSKTDPRFSSDVPPQIAMVRLNDKHLQPAFITTAPYENDAPSWNGELPLYEKFVAPPTLLGSPIPLKLRRVEDWDPAKNWKVSSALSGTVVWITADNQAQTVNLNLLKANGLTSSEVTRSVEQKQSVIETYRVEGLPHYEDRTFRVVLSPSKQQVLFEISEPRSSLWDQNLAYVWERETQELHPVWLQIEHGSLWNTAFFSWSPDEKYLLFLAYQPQGVKQEQLLTYQWRTGETTRIAPQKDTFEQLAFSWFPPHTVVFSTLPQTIGAEKPKLISGSPALRTNLYAAKADDGVPYLQIKDGQAPRPSPDGSLVAFFGSRNLQKPIAFDDDWASRPGPAFLCVAQAEGSQRKPLTQITGNYPQVFWLPDNHHFLTVQTDEMTERSQTITQWDGFTGQKQIMARLKEAEFKILDISEDEMIFRSVAALQKQNGIEEVTILHSLNLHNKRVQDIAQIVNVKAIDWLISTPK